jgi:hypothetical protein
MMALLMKGRCCDCCGRGHTTSEVKMVLPRPLLELLEGDINIGEDVTAM